MIFYPGHDRLLFGEAPAGDMFPKKIDILFNCILNVFGIAHESQI